MVLTLISLIFVQIEIIMALKIKELCKEKHITMAQIADKIGINPITLSQSLNGNPTLSRLQEVADILGVSVGELFDIPVKESIYGCLWVNGKPQIVNNKEEIENLINGLK